MGAGRTLYIGDELMGFDDGFRSALRDQMAIVNPSTGTDDIEYYADVAATAKMFASAKKALFKEWLNEKAKNDIQVTDLVLSLGVCELYCPAFQSQHRIDEFSNEYQAIIAEIVNQFKSLKRVILVIPPVMSADADKKVIAEKMLKMYRDVLTKEGQPFQLVAVDLLNSLPDPSVSAHPESPFVLTPDASKFALRLVAEAIALPAEHDCLLVVSGEDQPTRKIDHRFVDLTLPEHEVNLANMNPVDLFKMKLIFGEKRKLMAEADSKPASCARFKDVANGIMLLCGSLGTIGALGVGIAALSGLIALSATGIGLVVAGLVVGVGLFAGGLALHNKLHSEKSIFSKLCNSPAAAFNTPVR